jgi:hypothetical protein
MTVDKLTDDLFKYLGDLSDISDDELKFLENYVTDIIDSTKGLYKYLGELENDSGKVEELILIIDSLKKESKNVKRDT